MNEDDTFDTLKYRHYSPGGTVYWINDDDEFHRIGGPAIERSNGSKEWWVNGKLHRENGPAVEYYNGIKIWYRHGLKHREDGPAIETIEGEDMWFIDGKMTSFYD